MNLYDAIKRHYPKGHNEPLLPHLPMVYQPALDRHGDGYGILDRIRTMKAMIRLRGEPRVCFDQETWDPHLAAGHREYEPRLEAILRWASHFNPRIGLWNHPIRADQDPVPYLNLCRILYPSAYLNSSAGIGHAIRMVENAVTLKEFYGDGREVVVFVWPRFNGGGNPIMPMPVWMELMWALRVTKGIDGIAVWGNYRSKWEFTKEMRHVAAMQEIFA